MSINKHMYLVVVIDVDGNLRMTSIFGDKMTAIRTVRTMQLVDSDSRYCVYELSRIPDQVINNAVLSSS